MSELDLAEAARERFDFAEAEGRYTRALEILGVRGPRRMVGLRGRGLVRTRVGRGEEALADLAEAGRLARSLGDHEAGLGILLEQATAFDWSNDAAGASRMLAEAELLAKAASLPGALRAGLSCARGRDLLRQGRWSESWDALREAVAQAEQLGSAGFEPLVVALLLLEVVLPYLGRLPEAEAAALRAITLSRERGDKLHLASAINNRRNILVARKDLAGALADQRAFRELGRELGLTLSEYFAEFNLAELHYQAGDALSATPFAERAAGFEETQPSVAPRPSARLLQARLFAWQGLKSEARALLESVRAATERAQSANRAAGLLQPSEEVLATMVDLATRDATAADWDALVARSAKDSIEQEPIEVLELRALSAQRSGQPEVARSFFTQALELAARIPNLLDRRLRLELAAAG